jgi:exopolysaccharide biosynthesis protein
MIKNIAVLSILISSVVHAYQYKKHSYNNHVVHVVTVDPHEYEISLVKAHNTVFGREHVSQIAERSGAEIAINGGFFEVGTIYDGMPSGTHIADGIIFGLTLAEHDALIIDEHRTISMGRYHPCVVAMIEDVAVVINSVNQYVKNNEIILYTSGWGKSTLTPYAGRAEVVFDDQYHLQKVLMHGNNTIPDRGFVLSFPIERSLNLEKSKLYITGLYNNRSFSAIKGIPLLLQNGRILERVMSNQALGHTLPYARTALGIKKDGTIIVVIVEPFSTLDPKGMTLSDLKNVLVEKGQEFAQKLNKKMWEFTLFDLKNILKKEYTSRGREIVGLTMVELAQFMIDLGCDSAINLSGGATTALWIEGNEIVNEKAETTAVSDAIVFVKR